MCIWLLFSSIFRMYMRIKIFNCSKYSPPSTLKISTVQPRIQWKLIRSCLLRCPPLNGCRSRFASKIVSHLDCHWTKEPMTSVASEGIKMSIDVVDYKYSRVLSLWSPHWSSVANDCSPIWNVSSYWRSMWHHLAAAAHIVDDLPLPVASGTMLARVFQQLLGGSGTPSSVSWYQMPPLIQFGRHRLETASGTIKRVVQELHR